MKAYAKYGSFCFVLILSMLAGSAVGVGNPAVIEHRQVLTKILQESQVSDWKTEYGRNVSEITVSGDGNKIGFLVRLEPFSVMDTHIYAANADGSGLVDLTAGLPSEVNSDRNGMASLLLNKTGSRLFFRHPVFGTWCNLYYSNTASGACAKAVLDTIWDRDYFHPYFLAQDGEALYFKYNDPVNGECTTAGIYFSGVGGTHPVKWMGLNELAPYYDCGIGRLTFLGTSNDGSKAVFVWRPANCPSPDPLWSCKKTFYVRRSGQAPIKLDASHDYVWNPYGNCQRFISADGSKALYLFSDSNNPKELYWVDLGSGAKTLLAKTPGSLTDTDNMDLSPSGLYARLNTVWWGKFQGCKFTRFNLASGTKRDTLSHLINESYLAITTGFTNNDRFYFMASKDGNTAMSMKIHRLDLDPQDFSLVPYIQSINFSASSLPKDDQTYVTVYAKVTHTSGQDKIAWVKMHTLVQGLEWPFGMDYEPLMYDANLYDDGTHGDVVAGDGIYTNDTLRTRSSNFYNQYSLPGKVGIRIVAKDQSDNYGLADTWLTVFRRGAASAAGNLLLLD